MFFRSPQCPAVGCGRILFRRTILVLGTVEAVQLAGLIDVVASPAAFAANAAPGRQRSRMGLGFMEGEADPTGEGSQQFTSLAGSLVCFLRREPAHLAVGPTHSLAGF